MAEFLLFAVLVTDIVLVVIMWQAARLLKRIRTRFARLQATIVGLLCLSGIAASVQDVGVQITRLGWISESAGERFVGVYHVAIVVGGLIVLAPVLWILRSLTAEFATSEALTSKLVNRLPAGVTAETAGLTRRELDVATAIGAGCLSDSEIADELTVSPATAATHVRNIMRKTGIKRRGDIILLAVDVNDES